MELTIGCTRTHNTVYWNNRMYWNLQQGVMAVTTRCDGTHKRLMELKEGILEFITGCTGTQQGVSILTTGCNGFQNRI
jgi:hypothetical protein